MTVKQSIKPIFIIALLIFSTSKLFSQEVKIIDTAKYECKYLLTYQLDSTDDNSINGEEMILLIGNNYSKFQSIGGYLRDSVFKNLYSNKDKLESIDLRTLMANVPKTKFREIIYKDYSEGVIKYREKIFTNLFEYKDSLKLFDWKIYNEHENISGYDCQKATTNFAGREYEAWFTKELPISDGPYKFNGLPGLIVKINDTKKQYEYTLIGLQKASSKYITESKKNYFSTTKKDFRKTKEEFYKNIYNNLEQSGISINFDDESTKKRTLEKYRKRNNPIELVDE